MLDSNKIEALSEALASLRTMENVSAEASGKERRQIGTQVRQINKAITRLQTSVLESYSTEFAFCRDIGHVWKLKKQTVEDNVLYRLLECPRCTKQREDAFGRTGDLMSRRYYDPEDYALPTGVASAFVHGKAFWRGLSYMIAERASSTA